jgi:hypothetical protein
MLCLCLITFHSVLLIVDEDGLAYLCVPIHCTYVHHVLNSKYREDERSS